jgi:hypothetical protein
MNNLSFYYIKIYTNLLKSQINNKGLLEKCNRFHYNTIGVGELKHGGYDEKGTFSF